MAELLFETYGVPSVGKVVPHEKMPICIGCFTFNSQNNNRISPTGYIARVS